MKTVWLIGIALFTFLCSFGQSTEDNGKKKENVESTYRQEKTSRDEGPGFDSPQYNNNQVGDGHTEEDGQGDSGQGDDPGDQQGRVQEGISGAPEEDNSQLLGDDNRKAKKDQDSQGSPDYRNNEVSGNPNNTTISGGSNRQAEPAQSGANSQEVSSGNQTPGSAATDTGSTGEVSGQNTDGVRGATGTSNNVDGVENSGTSAAGSQATSTPSVIQSSSTQSGSPSTERMDGTDKDGTNNVQQAKPNMAGSDVSGIRSNGRSIDEDREIRKGTMQQQASPDPALAEQQQNQGGQNVGSGTTPSNSNAKRSNVSRSSQKQQPSGGDQPAAVRDEAPQTVGEGQEDQNDASQTPQVKAMDTESDLVTDKDRDEKKKSRKKRNRKNRD
jgi:hypothetical protein